ncbi:hypothetical protein HK405_002376 [Cladochytrium tenue]|nr:hypothetical protein HK405_002376 [Cladochytrium tenue]
MPTTATTALIAGILLTVAAHLPPATALPAPTPSSSSSSASSTAAAQHEFGYSSADPEVADPAHWADFYPACGGVRQSPIDIPASYGCTTAAASPLTFAGDCSNFTLSKTKEAYKVAVAGGSCVAQTVSAAYNLVGFHTHSLSEHKVAGLQHDAEMHFVHSRANGSALLVVGLFLQASDDSAVTTDPLFTSVLDGMDALAGGSGPLSLNLNSYAALLRSKMSGGSVFNYPGSLTTPPCSEIVDWWVVRAPLLVARSDLDRLHQHALEFDIYDNGRNARPSQPLNGRSVSAFSA